MKIGLESSSVMKQKICWVTTIKYRSEGSLKSVTCGTLSPVDGNLNTDKHISILDDHLWPVIAQHFPFVKCLPEPMLEKPPTI